MNAACRAVFLTAAIAPAVLAQRGVSPDSSRTDTLRTIVVIAERGSTALASASAAVTRLDAEALGRVPHTTLADVLRLVPGFALVDFDGLGSDPQVMVRGFYGGGEAEYVVVMVDGKPVTELHTGLVAWEVLPPLSSIAGVEVVRGAASALYGDAAVGAVINLITQRADSSTSARWSLGGGTFGAVRGSVDLSSRVSRFPVDLTVGVDRSDGYREHAGMRALRSRASVALGAADHDVTLSALSHWRDFDEPGPLHEGLLAGDRRASDALFRFDHTRDTYHRVSVDAAPRFGTGRLTASAFGEWRRTNTIRTIALAPGFGDTKERQVSARREGASAQLDMDRGWFSADRLTLGVELSHGRLDARYYAVITGDRDAFLASQGERGALDAHARPSRVAAALFAHYGAEPLSRVRLSLGLRGDWLRDAFNRREPDQELASPASHQAFSPKGGVNIQYLRSSRASGHLYASAGRSFKAPTLDQLFDQRTIPLPFPPFKVTTSNAALEPQSGTNVEGGLYQNVRVGSVRADASVSVYQIDMKNELDFDVQALRYVNIGRSRHRGIEAGLVVSGPRASSAFANYTLQAATSRSGPNEGKALKAIPRHVVTAGFSVQPVASLGAGLSATRHRGMFLDDANARVIPPYTRLDSQLSYRWRATRLVLEARNLLDATYSSTGFPDPSGSGEAYFYPAAGRVIEIGVRRGW